MSNTVKMVREAPVTTGGPVVADVHPGGVPHWTSHGWVAAEEANAAPNGGASTPSEAKPDKADKTKGKTKAADAADGDTPTP